MTVGKMIFSMNVASSDSGHHIAGSISNSAVFCCRTVGTCPFLASVLSWAKHEKTCAWSERVQMFKWNENLQQTTSLVRQKRLFLEQSLYLLCSTDRKNYQKTPNKQCTKNPFDKTWDGAWNSIFKHVCLNKGEFQHMFMGEKHKSALKYKWRQPSTCGEILIHLLILNCNKISKAHPKMVFSFVFSCFSPRLFRHVSQH